MKKIKKNTYSNLLNTLEFMESSEKQEWYKNTVPFVHIPIELLNQWSNYSRLMSEKRDWFLEIFSANQLLQMMIFDKEVKEFQNMIVEDDLDDVPEILNNELWLNLMRKAMILKKVISENLSEIIS